MCGKHGTKLGGARGRDDLRLAVAERLQACDRLGELVPSRWCTRGQILNAVDLLSGVGEVEVDGECADEMDRIDDGDVSQDFRETGSGRVLPAQGSGCRAHLFDAVEQALAVLTHECGAELVPEPPNVDS